MLLHLVFYDLVKVCSLPPSSRYFCSILPSLVSSIPRYFNWSTIFRGVHSIDKDQSKCLFLPVSITSPFFLLILEHLSFIIFALKSLQQFKFTMVTEISRSTNNSVLIKMCSILKYSQDGYHKREKITSNIWTLWLQVINLVNSFTPEPHKKVYPLVTPVMEENYNGVNIFTIIFLNFHYIIDI